MMYIHDDGVIRYKYIHIDSTMSIEEKVSLLKEIFAEYNPKIEQLSKVRTVKPKNIRKIPL